MEYKEPITNKKTYVEGLRYGMWMVYSMISEYYEKNKDTEDLWKLYDAIEMEKDRIVYGDNGGQY